MKCFNVRMFGRALALSALAAGALWLAGCGGDSGTGGGGGGGTPTDTIPGTTPGGGGGTDTIPGTTPGGGGGTDTIPGTTPGGGGGTDTIPGTTPGGGGGTDTIPGTTPGGGGNNTVGNNNCTSAASCKSQPMPDGKTWMLENLNINTANSWCYDDNPINCTKYGRLYTWAAAKAACPTGWHLPSAAELTALATAAGGGSLETAGKALKSTSGWIVRIDGTSGNGSDDYGFTALPGGWRDAGGSFDGEGVNASLWTATESDGSSAWFGGMTYSTDYALGETFDKNTGFSARCVAD